MAQIFGNFAGSTLDSELAIDGLSAVVVSAASFPAVSSPDYYYCVISTVDDSVCEVVKVTNLTGSTFTIVRAQDSSTAALWPVGSKFQLRAVAAAIRDVVSSVGFNIDGGNATSVYGGLSSIDCGGV